MASDLPSLLASDLQDQLDLLRLDFHEAAEAVEARRDERLRPFTEVASYVKAGGPLAVELAVLRARDAAAGVVCPRPRLLVMLCGLTAPPLLLSLRYLDPERVLLVHSDTFDGRSVMEKVRGQVEPERLLPALAISDRAPEEAFTVLRDGVQRVMTNLGLASAEVRIDITGGKKTMTAAAYLVASHLRVPMVYLDGDFDARLDLPWPGTAVLRELVDPATHFFLEEKRKAKEFFAAGEYTQAALLLREMGRDDDARRVEAAALWREALYQEAVEKLRPLRAPEALQRLAAQWPRLSGLWPKKNKDTLRLFPDPADKEMLIRFCADRLAWALRDLPQRPRRAFLEAYSACEAILEVIGENDRHPALGRETNGQDRPLRAHRNALVHRIAAPEPELIRRFLQAPPCLARSILWEAAGKLPDIDLQQLQPLSHDPLAGLAELEPAWER